MDITIHIPSPRSILGQWKWALMAAIVSLAAFGLSTEGERPALAASGNNFSIAATTGACDTNPGTPAGTSCTFAPGASFTVRVSLDKISLPNNDGDGKSGWLAVDGRLTSSAGLPYTDRPGLAEITAPNPPCGITAESTSGAPTSYLAACVLGVGQNESLYTGQWLEVDYTCNTSGTVALIHGAPSNTHITDDGLNAISNDPSGASETLNIACTTQQEILINSNTSGLATGPAGGACYMISPVAAGVATFIVCDNETGAGVDSSTACSKDGDNLCTDTNPAHGDITVAVNAGQYEVNATRPPAGHAIDAHQKSCDPPAGVDVKCTFTHTPRPWFPGDLDGDGAVAGTDFFAVLALFGQVNTK